MITVQTINKAPNIWEKRSKSLVKYLNARLTVTNNNMIRFIKLDEILYVQAASNYSEINLSNGTIIITTKILKYYEHELENRGFLRVHNSYLVNLDKVKGIKRNGSNLLIMENDLKIPVSKSYWDAIFINII